MRVTLPKMETRYHSSLSKLTTPMAKVALNSSLRSLSGAIDNWVFRQVNDRTVISRQHKGPAPQPSPAQLLQRQRFKRAQEYAVTVLSDPCQRRAYEAIGAERKRRPDKILESDFLTPPVVDLIELSGYKGRAGNLIRVLASDDVEVVSVKVALRDAQGTVVEEGPAAKIHGVWVYSVTTHAPEPASLAIEATAMDRPGNTTARTARPGQPSN